MTTVIHPVQDNSSVDPQRQRQQFVQPERDSSSVDPERDSSCVDPERDSSCVDPECDSSSVDLIHDTSCSDPVQALYVGTQKGTYPQFSTRRARWHMGSIAKMMLSD